MKKLMLLGSVAVLLSVASNAQAQFGKNLSKAAANAAKLERSIAKAAEGVRPGRVIVSVPVVGRIALTAPKVPTVGNAVNSSYLYKIENEYKQLVKVGIPATREEIAQWQLHSWANDAQSLGHSKGFYDDQSALARDLNAYYEGSGVAVKSPDGKMGKLYALPADGILYQPAGYTQPVVLEAERYFVVYYPKFQTGQLVQDTPETRALFSKPTNSGSFEEVTTVGGYAVQMPLGEPDWELLEGTKTAEPAPQNAAEVQGDFEEVK